MSSTDSLPYVRFLNGSFVLTLYENIQIRVTEFGHATVKYFIEIWKLSMFLKNRLCPKFLFLKMVLVY